MTLEEKIEYLNKSGIPLSEILKKELLESLENSVDEAFENVQQQIKLAYPNDKEENEKKLKDMQNSLKPGNLK